MRPFPFILLVVISAAFALMLLQMSEEKKPSHTANSPFPPIAVTAFDGKTAWNPEALKGRVTVINFYASWCTPCAAEMPEFQALKKQFPKLHLAGIAWNDEPRTLTRWLQKNGNPFHSSWLDSTGNATIDLGIKGIPETIIVDHTGTIRYRLAGQLTPEMRAGEVGELLTVLLSEASNAH
jgi:cytochrome c biogenesis protein CcmG, thiol:disulfide interchange protein DsbE